MIVNTAQGGGKSLPLNLFVQPDEPAAKDGLWIQAPEKHPVNRIITKDSFIIGGTRRSTRDYKINFDLIGMLFDGDYIYAAQANGISRYNISTETTLTCNISPNFGFNEVDYGLCYKINDKIHYKFCGKWSSSTWRTYYGSFTPDEFDSDTIPEATYTESSSGDSCKLYSRDDDYLIILHYKSDLGYYITKAELLNIETGTSQNYSISNRYYTNDKPYAGIALAVYDSTLYIFRHYTNDSDKKNIIADHFDRIDLLTGETLDEITGFSIPIGSCSGIITYFYTEAFQNKILFGVPNGFIMLDLTTKTTEDFSALTMDNNKPFRLKENIVLFSDSTGTAPHYPAIFDLQSEKLSENQIAILNGRTYSYRLLSTRKINYIASHLADVWWYDTDFREYPTYIGDGTQWNKIKN